MVRVLMVATDVSWPDSAEHRWEEAGQKHTSILIVYNIEI